MSERKADSELSRSARRRARHRRNRDRKPRLDEQNGVGTIEAGDIGERGGNDHFADGFQTGEDVFVRFQHEEATNGHVTTVHEVHPETHFDAAQARQFLLERWIAVTCRDLENTHLDPVGRTVLCVSPGVGSAKGHVGRNLQRSAGAGTPMDSRTSNQLKRK